VWLEVSVVGLAGGARLAIHLWAKPCLAATPTKK